MYRSRQSLSDIIIQLISGMIIIFTAVFQPEVLFIIWVGAVQIIYTLFFSSKVEIKEDTIERSFCFLNKTIYTSTYNAKNIYEACGIGTKPSKFAIKFYVKYGFDINMRNYEPRTSDEEAIAFAQRNEIPLKFEWAYKKALLEKIEHEEAELSFDESREG
ncbi:hypothetical protein [Salsuginibacillus kocurii]|uniref:hypothetical protein n=1 Tax=Salsuginibacillus kocurii TaxID=427078 RepID=UPI00037C7FC8|nr:hypothetical protein [Salsuginibacillus kocurii]